MKNSTIILASAMALLSSQVVADTSLNGLKERIVGRWESIACEIRPQQNAQNPQAVPSASYLTRDFTYDADGGFEAAITVFADAKCEIPATTFSFAGDIVWHDENPAAVGAWSQDYVLNEKLEMTVHAQPAVDQLNQLPEGACGTGPFQVGVTRDILGQPCALLRFVEGSAHVIDHDFLYVRSDTPNMLFMGGKHVDGSGFYYPENRPMVGLQQPLIKVQ